MRPGRDYALTELVHCKSPNEIGVTDALKTCTDRYMEAVLNRSVARVIVGIGAPARRALAAYLRLSSTVGGQAVRVGGRDRVVVFLAAPSAFGGTKTFVAALGASGLADVQRRVARGES